MLQRRLPSRSGPDLPQRQLRLVIEDPVIARDRGPVEAGATPFDVRVCAGPRSSAEVCPLVTEGRCPLGPCDAVVTAIDGPWAHCVRAAWRQAGVPVVEVPGGGATDARVRLDRAVAATMAALAPTDPPVGSD